MTDHDEADPAGPGMIRVSRLIKTRFDQIQADLETELGRRVTQSEVMERLLANQWGCKP